MQRDETAPDASAGHSSTRSRLRAKLPEILLEAASVVFAVLFALAVDEWRDNRARRDAAARARESILREVRANHREIDATREANRANLESMAAQTEALKQRTAKELRTNMTLAQLSSAAWQTAQSTNATQLIDFDWLVEVSRAYETQRVFIELQNDVIPRLGDVASASSDAQRLAIMQQALSRMTILDGLAGSLSKVYAELEQRSSASP